MRSEKILLEDRKIPLLNQKLESLRFELINHPVYDIITDISSLKTFMEYHVFAVWDFMSLVKSLQKEITCIEVPWKPSSYSKDLVRFINEIVLDEESDKDDSGKYSDHFSLYLEAMKEVGANTSHILKYLDNFDANFLPIEVKDFIDFTLDVCRKGSVNILAGVFFFGRESIIPSMFQKAVSSIEHSYLNNRCNSVKYYFQRHIELDSESHSPLASKLLESACEGDATKFQQSLTYGIKACLLRKNLLDRIMTEISIHRNNLHS